MERKDAWRAFARAILVRAGATAILAGAAGMPAHAHHSFAMFDYQKPRSLTGDVRDFQWTNPHSWLQVTVRGEDGQAVEWSFELGSPNALSRSGVRKNTFRSGDHVTVEFFPIKDGDRVGALSKVLFAGGKGFVFGVGGNSAGRIE